MNNALISSGREFLGSSGRWAGERFIAAAARGEKLSPAVLRTLDTLRKDDWKFFDNALVSGFRYRLRAVADLLGAGLVLTIPNGLAKTVLEYQKIGDMQPATVSLDGITRAENDRVEFETAGLPLPITHKDWYLNLRALMASRERGEPLDVTHTNAAGRKIGELTEEMLFQGSKTFGQLTVYGYMTHPDRNTSGFGTNGDWGQAAKTGENIIADINTMKAILEADGFYGPYWIYAPADASNKFGDDFKANSDKTVRQRILEMDGIDGLRIVDKLPSSNVIMVQHTPDVVQMVSGEPLQNVQWDVQGGFQINFKGFQILVPLVKSDSEGKSGVYHMAD
jgi:uncharacterized linocin/CFP29 family protein